MFTVNRPVCDALAAKYSYPRAIFLDVEPANVETSADGVESIRLLASDVSGNCFALVLRSKDKTLNDAGPSEAKDGEDRKGHKPQLYWNDEQCAHRPFIVATFDDKDSAETCAAQLLDFYSEAIAETPVGYSDRLDALGSDARALLPLMIATFGAVPNSDMQASERNIGTFADYCAPRTRKSNGKRKAVKPTLDDATAVLLEAAAQKNANADLQSQLAELLAKINATAAS